MDRLIEKGLLSQALSDDQILRLTERRARFVSHEEIKKYSNIEDLLGPKEACIILYVTAIKPDNSIFGHWCCVFRAPWAPNTVSYFDPYGEPPDVPLKFMSPEAVAEFGNQRDLSRLLDEAVTRGIKVVYNVAPLQKHEKGNAICGRLTGLRLQFKHLDGNQFAEMMQSYENRGLSSDALAAMLTSFIN